MFKETLKEIKESPIKFFIGSIIHSFWFLIIPEFFVIGYLDRKMQSNFYGIFQLPNWKNIGNLFVRGSRLISIVLLYMIIPIALAMISIPTFQKPTNITPVYIVDLGLLLFMSFLLIGGIANYVRNENKFIKAFNLKEIFEIMIHNPKDYIKAYLIVSFLGIFSLIVMAVPIIGLFIFGFINFFILLTGANLISKLGGASYEKSEGFQTEEEYYY